MPIKHEWNGTILTITSDSGTSSADLKGSKGDTGARGARGLTGATGGGALIEDGVISSDTTWSSAGIMDRFAEQLATTGNPVSCNPIPDFPLHVITSFDVKQSGSGEPYPAGAGKNLIQNIFYGYVTNDSYISLDNNSVSFIAGIEAGQTYTISCEVSLDRLRVAKTETLEITNSQQLTNNKYYGDLSNVNTVSFTAEFTGLAVIYVKSIKDESAKNTLQLEKGSTATAYEPYSNIRPISGMNAVNVVRSGKNLLKLNENASETKGGITFTANADGTVSLSGTATNDVYKEIATNVKLANGEYILTGCPTGAVNTNYILYFAPAISSNKIDTGNGVKFTVDNTETYKVMIRIIKGTNTNGLIFKPMIRLATETDATNEPYKGNTYTMDLGGTYYSGVLDWNTGLFIADKACIIFDGTEALNTQAESNLWIRYNYSANSINALLPAYSAICSHFKTRQANTTETRLVNSIEIHGSSNYPIFRVDANKWGTAEQWKAYVTEQYNAGTPIQIAYELAEPITIQLTPQEIKAISGTNTLFTDADEIKVAGRVDTMYQLYLLEQRIAALEAKV